MICRPNLSGRTWGHNLVQSNMCLQVGSIKPRRRRRRHACEKNLSSFLKAVQTSRATWKLSWHGDKAIQRYIKQCIFKKLVFSLFVLERSSKRRRVIWSGAQSLFNIFIYFPIFGDDFGTFWMVLALLRSAAWQIIGRNMLRTFAEITQVWHKIFQHVIHPSE